MNNSLSKKFTFPSMLAFTLPNVVMMLFLSMYTIVDGMFVSRFVGTTALSSVNMVYPVISAGMAIAIMLSTGGSAIIAIRLGEGKIQTARENFTFLVLVEVILGILSGTLGLLFVNPLLSVLGTTAAQFEMCKTYISTLFIFAPFFFLQTAFQTFFVTSGRPGLGLTVTVLAGLTNMALDYVFIVPLNMGVAGAALATGIGYSIPAVTGIVYFLLAGKNSLHFTKPKFDGYVLWHSCTNGSSEMVSNLANAVTTFLFNLIFLKYYGEDGVASITIVLYFQFVFSAIYFGYASGIAPVISFKYGHGEHRQLKSIIKNSLFLILAGSVITFILSFGVMKAALPLFTGTETDVYRITMDGFRYYAPGFLFMGVSIFASAMFTAFSDGLVSAVISFARTFVFLAGAILLLPLFIGKTGLWLAVPIAEILGFFISVFFLVRKRKKYHYT